MCNQLIANEYCASLIVFITQLIFIYFRTLNVIYTTKGRIWDAVWTNNVQTFAWLIATSIGVNSTVNGQFLPAITFILGSSVGTYFAMKNKIE